MTPRTWPSPESEGPDRRGSRGGQQAHALRVLRRWSPLGVPVALTGLFLLLAGALAAHGIGPKASAGHVDSVWTLFTVYLILGTALGIALRFARSDILWLSVVLAGTVAFVVALVSVIFGIVPGVLVVLAAGLSALFYTQRHLTRVNGGTVVLTTAFGRYSRTLHPGLNVTLPFERIALTLETGERKFTTPALAEELRAATGVRYSARAAATVTYHILPEEASRTLLAGERWERDMHNVVLYVLKDSLKQWSAQMLATGEPPQQGSLAQEVLVNLRSWARGWGVWVSSVRIRNAQLSTSDTGMLLPMSGPLARARTSRPPHTPSDRHDTSYPPATREPVVAHVQADSAGPSAYALSASAQLPTEYDAAELAVAGFGSAPAPVSYVTPSPYGAPSPFGASYASGEYALASQIPTPSSAPLGAEQVLPRQSHFDAFSADTLADSYEAIRAQRISDPGTIRAVADAFAHVADSRDEVPFDAAAAARILWNYAAQLEKAPLVPAGPAL